MANLDRLADLVLNTPLLLHPDKLNVIAGLLSRRMGFEMPEGEVLEPGASRFTGSRQRGRDVTMYRTTAAGTAIIEVHGSLVNRGAWLNASSGLTSYEGIKAQLAAAESDTAVKAVLLDVNSPGGQATGAFETAEAVRTLAAKKPVVAVVDGMAASAGYAIPSGATKIVTTPTGLVGSIGVVVMHLDYSRALDRQGITPTLLHAGARKIDGNPAQPLTDDAKTALQAEIDKLMEMFAETVAAGRGSKLTKAMVLATEAQVYTGAEAVRAGLADEVGTFDRALSALERGAVKPSPRSTYLPASSSPGEKRFTRADLDRARAEGYDSVVAEAKAEAFAKAKTAGILAERKRWNDVHAGPEFVGRRDIAWHLLASTSMSADEITGLLKALPKAASQRLGQDGRPLLRARDAEFGLVLDGPVPGATKALNPNEIFSQRADAMSRGRTP